MNKIWYAPNKKQTYDDKEINAVVDCLNDGWLSGFGDKSIQFENEVSILFGKKHGLFVNSGSSAILLGLKSLNLKEGDEVITPACTFATTVAPIIQCGLKPVFCDVELQTYVPSVNQVLSKITDKTKVILLANLIGSKPDWCELRKLTNIILFEDSADTITCTPETDISITSFYSSHLITACGSGGMVMFNNEVLLKQATKYRDWGRVGDNSEEVVDRFSYNIDGISYDYKFLYDVVGYNMKSSEVNAAFGLVQLTKLDKFINIRKLLFNRYLENLKNEPDVILPINKFDTTFMAFPLMNKNRMELVKFLENNNIQTRVCFSGNITRHPAYREYFEIFENSDKIMAEGILLGCHHGMNMDDVDYICNKIKEFNIKNKIVHHKKKFLIYPHNEDFYFMKSSGGHTCFFYLAYLLDKHSNLDVKVYGKYHIENDIFNKYYNLNEYFDKNNTIIIYGENTIGNPLNGKYVIRWIQAPFYNTESWGKNDLVYYFNPDETFNTKLTNKYKLLSSVYIPNINIDNNLLNKNINYCFLKRKMDKFHKNVIYFHPEDSIDLDNSDINDCIYIFKKAKMFFSYDPLTFYTTMAALCGCISIVYPIEGHSKMEWLKTLSYYNYFDKIKNYQLYGVAYGNSTEEISMAIKSLHLVKQQTEDYKNFCIANTVHPFIEDIKDYNKNINTVGNIFYSNT